MKIPYNDAIGKTFKDADLVSDSNVDLYKWISSRPLTEDESNMPADLLATWAMHQANLSWSGNHGAFLHKIAITLKKQQDRIDVLEAKHKIQLDINEKALQYIKQLEQGLRASIDLNKAQALRKAQEK